MFLPKVYHFLVQTPSNLLGQALVPWNSFSALQHTHSFIEGKVCPTWNKKLLASQKWSITLAYYLGSYSPHKKSRRPSTSNLSLCFHLALLRPPLLKKCDHAFVPMGFWKAKKVAFTRGFLQCPLFPPASSKFLVENFVTTTTTDCI